MATTISGTGITYPDGSIQVNKKHIVKTRTTAGSTVDQYLPTWGTESDITDAYIDMGVPEKSNNWYRVEYYTCSDDANPNGNGGFGYACYRWTPSAGWLRAQAQGQHANYDNNCGDFYTTAACFWYIPVNASYASEPHHFKLMGTKHPDCGIRINCSIGADNRVGGWQNNMFMVQEIDGDNIQAINNLTTY